MANYTRNESPKVVTKQPESTLRAAVTDPRNITLHVKGHTYPENWDAQRLAADLELVLRQVIQSYVTQGRSF